MKSGTRPGPFYLWIPVLAIVLVGGFLRCVPLHESLWVDELHTAWVVAGEAHDVATRAHLGNNGAAWFISVKLITDTLGLQEWTLRLASIVAGIALLPGTWFLARHWQCSTTTSLLAVALVAVDGNALFFSGEARVYATVQLFAMIHLSLFSRLCLQPQRTATWIFWICSGIVLFHLHCTTALVLVAEVIAYALLWRWHKEPATSWIYMALGLAAMGLAMLPAAGLVREIAQRRDNWSMFIQQTGNPLAIFQMYPLHVYLLMPLVAIGITWLLERFRLREDVGDLDEPQADETPVDQQLLTGPLIIALTWILVPLVLAWLATELDFARLFHRRYLISSSVALAPGTALILSRSKLRASVVQGVALGVFVIALLTISPLKQIRYGRISLRHASEDWQSAVATINSADDSTPVILYSGLIEADAWHASTVAIEREYCELPVRGIYPLDEGHRLIVLARTLPLELAPPMFAEVDDSVWFLIRGDWDTSNDVVASVLSTLPGSWMTSAEVDGRVQLIRAKRL